MDKTIDSSLKTSNSNGEGTFTIECPNCYFKYTIETPEEFDVYECEDCSIPIVIESVLEYVITYKAFVFEQEEWRE